MPAVKWLAWPSGAEVSPPEGSNQPPPIGRNVLQLVNIKQTANYTCVASSKLGVLEEHTSVVVQCE
jgi:netrin-G3 ligand